ncbi:MAG: endonuclease/exonuclease/phosphatase family protein [Bacteroidota bacterium]
MLFISTVCGLSTSAIAQDSSMRIMTYNIRYDNPNDGVNAWMNRKEWLAETISAADLDILGIQEGLHHQVTYLDSLLPGFSYLGSGRQDGKEQGEYAAIFYKTQRFEVIKNGVFWLSETPETVSVGWDASLERICTYALLKEKETGESIWVLNTHFDHKGEQARVASAKLILEWIDSNNPSSLPVVLMGDLNARESSEPIHLFSEYLVDTKAIPDSLKTGPYGTFNGFDVNTPLDRRLDYIFVSGRFTIHSYSVLNTIRDQRTPSDHLPVLAEISL